MFRELMRKNKQITRDECATVLKNETRGILSVIGDEGYPYGMPMNHWYDEETGDLYFHCGNVGHRLEALRKCNKVSFCTFDKGYREEGQWAWMVKSVILFGKIEIIDDEKEINRVVSLLSRKFIDDEEYIQKEIEAHGHRTLLLRMHVEHMCGKLVTES